MVCDDVMKGWEGEEWQLGYLLGGNGAQVWEYV